MGRGRILILIFFMCLVSTAWSQAQAGPKQQLTTFDVSGAGRGAGQGTFANGINSGGAIAGGYVDANGAIHGFLLNP